MWKVAVILWVIMWSPLAKADDDMVLTHIDGNKPAYREETKRKEVKIDWEKPPKKEEPEVVDCGKQLWYKDTDGTEWLNELADRRKERRERELQKE